MTISTCRFICDHNKYQQAFLVPILGWHWFKIFFSVHNHTMINETLVQTGLPWYVFLFYLKTGSAWLVSTTNLFDNPEIFVRQIRPHIVPPQIKLLAPELVIFAPDHLQPMAVDPSRIFGSLYFQCARWAINNTGDTNFWNHRWRKKNPPIFTCPIPSYRMSEQILKS